jgi:hypothetical protein
MKKAIPKKHYKNLDNIQINPVFVIRSMGINKIKIIEKSYSQYEHLRFKSYVSYSLLTN